MISCQLPVKATATRLHWQLATNYWQLVPHEQKSKEPPSKKTSLAGWATLMASRSSILGGINAIKNNPITIRRRLREKGLRMTVVKNHAGQARWSRVEPN